jgi:predicted SprT family Zn-dependent metalloprotease
MNVVSGIKMVQKEPILLKSVLLVLGYLQFGRTALKYQKASDEKFHLVRDMPDKEKAAEILSEIKRRLQLLIKYCVQNYPNDANVMLMKQRFNPQNVQETDINESGTSYTIDKGKELHLCLRNKEDAELHQINILMFVAIHELAHIKSVSYGHNEEFGKHFQFLLNQASKIGIYQPVDYSKNPVEFCGMEVNANPIYE